MSTVQYCTVLLHRNEFIHAGLYNVMNKNAKLWHVTISSMRQFHFNN